MADKIFIGRVFEDNWKNPKLQLSAADLDILKGMLDNDRVSVVIKTSPTKGTKYAEVDTFKPTRA